MNPFFGSLFAHKIVPVVSFSLGNIGRKVVKSVHSSHIFTTFYSQHFPINNSPPSLLASLVGRSESCFRGPPHWTTGLILRPFASGAPPSTWAFGPWGLLRSPLGPCSPNLQPLILRGFRFGSAIASLGDSFDYRGVALRSFGPTTPLSLSRHLTTVTLLPPHNPHPLTSGLILRPFVRRKGVIRRSVRVLRVFLTVLRT